MAKIILLGASGFLGQSLLRKLKENKFTIKIMVHSNDFQTEVEKFAGDILSPGTLDNEISDNDMIINLIGQINPNRSNFIDLNIKGGLNLLNSCLKKKIKRIILISSINVYGENMKRSSKETDSLRPQTTYGLIKLLTEKIYQNYSEVYGMNITILRLPNLYGPGKKTGFIANLINSVNNSKKPFMAFNNGRQARDLLFVDDASNGIIQTIKTKQKQFEILNISSSKRYMIKNIIKLIEKISHKKLNVEFISYAPDEKCIWADNSKAKKILKFQPETNIEEGLKFTISKIAS